MLRAVVIVTAAILASVGIALIAYGVAAPGWQALGIGTIVLIGTLFERWRYRNTPERPNQQWQSTGERFLDPSTGRPVDVQFDPRTGERRYVVDNSPQKADPPP